MASRAGAESPAAGGMPASGPGSAALPGSAAAAGASGAGAPGGGAGGGNGAAALAGIGFVLQKAQQAGAAASARMEQTAAHAGMHGAYPYSTVSRGQRQEPEDARQPRQGGATAPPSAETARATAETAMPWQQDTPSQASEPPTEPIPHITGTEEGQ